MNKSLDPKHGEKKAFLKFTGLIILGVGIVLMVIAFADFMSTFSNPFSGPPTKFGLFFIGMPFVFIGFLMTSAGFMGEVAKYQADEIAPVASNVVNYMAHETKESVGLVAKAIKSGLIEKSDVACLKCKTLNAADAKFCKQCGAPFKTHKFCDKCGDENTVDARYCDACGEEI